MMNKIDTLINKVVQKVDPRFVDIEGFDVTRKRDALAYVASPAVLAALVFSGGALSFASFAPDFAAQKLSTMFSIATGAISGTVYAMRSHRKALKALPNLKEATIDHQGRMPQPENRAQLYLELICLRQSTLSQTFHTLALGVATTAAVVVAGRLVPDSTAPQQAAITAAMFFMPVAANQSTFLMRANCLMRGVHTFCARPNIRETQTAPKASTQAAPAMRVG